MIRRFVLTLILACLPSLGFGQEFNVVVDSSYYPSNTVGNKIPLSPGQAVLRYRLEPRGGSVVNADIIPNAIFNSGMSGGFGWNVNEGEINVDGYSLSYIVCDSSTLYVKGSGFPVSRLRAIQRILTSKDLGTVQQRAAFIAGFSVKDVNIVDTAQIMQNFQDLLGPWATIAVGFAIALFCLELGTRNTKQLAGDAAMEARASVRRVVNREIRDDPIAGQFRAHMDNLASVMRNTYGFHDASTRAQARDLFEQAARDYASYKKSRGWTV